MRSALHAFVFVFISFINSCTCSHKCASGKPATPSHQSASVEGYHCSKPRKGETFRWPMHDTRTSGPPVLLLHDILGPRPSCLELGRIISRMPPKYCVYVPTLYGAFGRESQASAFGFIFFNRPGWDFRAKNYDQPALADLLQLCATLRARHHGRRVIVISNCATGGMGAALLSSPDVCAAVCSQPAIPFSLTTSGKHALDVSPGTLRKAREHAATLKQPSLLGFRFCRDSFSTQHRFEHLQSEFGRSFSGVVLCQYNRSEQNKIPAPFRSLPTCNSKDHSVLIPKDNEPLPPHYSKVIKVLGEFLARHAE